MMPTGKRQRWAETLIAVILVGAALRVGEGLFAPLMLAFVSALVLAPVFSFLTAHRVPGAMAAALSMLLGLLLLVALGVLLRPWAVELVEGWPRWRSELTAAVADLRLRLTGLFEVQREVMEAIAPDTAQRAAEGGSEAGSAMPSLVDAAWLAPQMGGQLLIFIGGLFFILLGRDSLHDAALRLFGGENGWIGPDTLVRAERRVARYFGAISLINLGLGVAVGVALTVLGVPGAPIWGMVAGLTNFIVYLGTAVTAAGLLLAGTVSFDGPMVAVPALTFLFLNFLEAQFITPMIVGRQMRMNPLAVFLSVTFGIWLWGPVGGILAIPLVIWVTAIWPHPIAGTPAP